MTAPMSDRGLAAVPNSDAIGELAARVGSTIREQLRTPLLDDVRRFANEAQVAQRRAGLDDAVKRMHDAPDVVRNAAEKQRDADDRLRAAKEEYETIVVEKEWEVSAARFVTEANKTYLVTACGETHAVGVAQPCTECGGTGVIRGQSMTADERARWVAHFVQTLPAVKGAKGKVDQARSAVDMAKVDAASAQDQWIATRYATDAARSQLDASVGVLAALARTLGGA